MDTRTVGVTIDLPIGMTETRPQRGLIARNWRWIFLAMLVTLHIAVVRGVGDSWARGLMVASFGLFILWQPFMRGEYRLSFAQLGGIATACALVLWALNWWLLLLWAAALAGLVGGKMFLFQERWLRRFYLLALAYLIMLVLVGIVPQLFPGEISSSAYVWLARYGLPILIVPLALFPVEAPSSDALPAAGSS